MERDLLFIEDCIDIALMQDDNYVAQLEQLKEDLELGIEENVFQESVEDIFTESGCSGEIHSDDAPQYSFTPVDEAANEYMDSYYEIAHGGSISDMIDHIAD